MSFEKQIILGRLSGIASRLKGIKDILTGELLVATNTTNSNVNNVNYHLVHSKLYQVFSNDMQPVLIAADSKAMAERIHHQLYGQDDCIAFQQSTVIYSEGAE